MTKSEFLHKRDITMQIRHILHIYVYIVCVCMCVVMVKKTTCWSHSPCALTMWVISNITVVVAINSNNALVTEKSSIFWQNHQRQRWRCSCGFFEADKVIIIRFFLYNDDVFKLFVEKKKIETSKEIQLLAQLLRIFPTVFWIAVVS